MGQKAGVEHAIHSLRAAFNNKDAEAILLIDKKRWSQLILP